MSKNVDFLRDTINNNIKYNSETGLYDIYKLNTLKPIANTIKIYNNTTLVYVKDVIGFFYISHDNKYIYLDGSNSNLDIEYLNFSIQNPSVTNSTLYDIYSTVSVSSKKINNETYNEIQERLSKLTLTKQVCISFAYEQDSETRKKQIKLLLNNQEYKIYKQYDCNVNTNEVFSPITGVENYDFSPSTNPNNTTVVCNSNNITQFNSYYMYGLTVLNGLLILITIALILLVFDDNGKKEK